MKIPFNKSVLIAAVIGVSATIWLASGAMEDKTPPPAKSVVETHKKSTVKVLVAEREAITHADVIKLYGQTEANREVTLKAETAGRIEELLIEKGAFVKKGDVIARIAMEDRQRRLKSAQAAVRHRELEYDASRKLSQKSFRSQTKLAEAASLLNSARAELESIRVDIKHTTITAPFDGYLEDTVIEVGDFLDTGGEIAKIVDLSPIVIKAHLPEHAVSRVHDGQPAMAVFPDGRKLDGIVRFVATTSDSSTRTYRVEMEAANDGEQKINAGLTASLQLNVGQRTAHQVSPAILTLSDNGRVGVKTVDADNKVVFHPIQLLEDTADGVWVTGLPQKARIITRGQEYVSPGQEVIAVDANNTQNDEKKPTKDAPALAKAQGN